MNQYEYTVIGSFAENSTAYGGQTHKTRNFTDQLEKEGKSVLRVDSHGWKHKIISFVKEIKQGIDSSEEIIMLPADGGVKIIPRLVLILKRNRNIKVKYVVVGGWLPEFLKKNYRLIKTLKKLDGIYVETQTMKSKLEKMGFKNIYYLPNFKNLRVLGLEECVFYKKPPYRVCTFSRVLKEKGIEDAVNAVKRINSFYGKTIYKLDIYGKIDDGQKEWFNKIQSQFTESIEYKGLVDGSMSTKVLKDYYLLLFPTYYSGEGYPGTLLDAFSAGVPVIASNWAYNAEIVNDKLGFLYPAKDVDALIHTLKRVAEDPNCIHDLKKNCLDYASSMSPHKVIQVILNT